MSLKVKISYDTPDEFWVVYSRLKDILPDSSKPVKTGQHTRVYLRNKKQEKLVNRRY